MPFIRDPPLELNSRAAQHAALIAAITCAPQVFVRFTAPEEIEFRRAFVECSFDGVREQYASGTQSLVRRVESD